MWWFVTTSCQILEFLSFFWEILRFCFQDGVSKKEERKCKLSWNTFLPNLVVWKMRAIIWFKIKMNFNETSTKYQNIITPTTNFESCPLKIYLRFISLVNNERNKEDNIPSLKIACIVDRGYIILSTIQGWHVKRCNQVVFEFM